MTSGHPALSTASFGTDTTISPKLFQARQVFPENKLFWNHRVEEYIHTHTHTWHYTHAPLSNASSDFCLTDQSFKSYSGSGRAGFPKNELLGTAEAQLYTHTGCPSSRPTNVKAAKHDSNNDYSSFSTNQSLYSIQGRSKKLLLFSSCHQIPTFPNCPEMWSPCERLFNYLLHYKVANQNGFRYKHTIGLFSVECRHGDWL